MKQSKLSLVNGDFTPEEALEVLMNLYSSKINFHELKNFSSQERFGYPDVHSQKRLPELKKTMKEISILFRDLKESGEEINIQSDIIITSNNQTKRKDLQKELSSN